MVGEQNSKVGKKDSVIAGWCDEIAHEHFSIARVHKCCNG